MGEGKRQTIALAHKFHSGRHSLENRCSRLDSMCCIGIVCCSDLPQPWKRSSPQLLQVMSVNPKGIFHFMPNGTLTMVSCSPGLVLFPEPTTSDECDIKRENSSLDSPGMGDKGLSLLSVGVVEIPVAAMLGPMSSSANFCCHSFKSHAGECSLQ